MKIIEYIQGHNYTGVLLYLMLAIANINYSGMLDYALQAIIGGIVWFGFKILGDHYDKKRKVKELKERRLLRMKLRKIKK